MIPSKYILAFDVQVKTRYIKRLKYASISKGLQFHRQSIKNDDIINISKYKFVFKRFLHLICI